MENQAVEEEYLALVRAFPLLSICGEEHLSEALAVIDRLTDKPRRSAAEDAYLSALTDLVELYENAHIEIPPVSPEDALRYLMEENRLTTDDLVSSPEAAARILQHWLLAHGSAAEQERRNDASATFNLFAAQPHTPSEQWIWTDLATQLGVPPDALNAFMEAIAKKARSQKPKSTSDAQSHRSQ